jgi:uncharacterized repeat protein (TIGR02543 family)
MTAIPAYTNDAITFADRLPAGSQPEIELHFSHNVTNPAHFQSNLGKIHMYDENYYEVMYSYRLEGNNNSIIVIKPYWPLPAGLYTLMIDPGIASGGGNDVRYSTQGYTIYIIVGSEDIITEPVDPDVDTGMVHFNISGVYGTSYNVSVTNRNTGAMQSNASGYFILPIGEYTYSVSASGHSTVLGSFYMGIDEEVNISVMLSDRVLVTITTSPSDASVTLKMGQNDYVTPEYGYTYKVQPGLEYTYVVMKEGYIVESSRFTVGVVDETRHITLTQGTDGQGNGGNTLTLLSPSEFTLEEKAEYYDNKINSAFDVSEDIAFKFTMGSGVNSFGTGEAEGYFFINNNLPLIKIYDKYPNGNEVSRLEYVGFNSVASAITIKTPEKLKAGAYYLVFGRDISGNNLNKTLGKDVVFVFTVKDSSIVYHTVYFNTSGGTQLDALSVESGKMVDKPADPTMSGFVFNGWIKDGAPFDFNTPITGDTTLTAVWRSTDPNIVTVTFDSAGGSAINIQSFSKGESAKEPNDPSREGYVFLGWYQGESLYDFGEPVVDDLILHAKWGESELIDEHGVPLASGKKTIASFKDLKDLPPDTWFLQAISFVLERGLFSGTSENEFSPQLAMNRGMFITVLGRLAGVTGDTESKEPAFNDVNNTEYFARHLQWAYENGLVGGYPDGSFGPAKPISRQEVIVFLHRYAKFAQIDTSFTDTGKMELYTDASGLWAGEAMGWAVHTGLMVGKTATTLNPNDTTTRAEMAALLQRFIINFVDINTEKSESQEPPQN